MQAGRMYWIYRILLILSMAAVVAHYNFVFTDYIPVFRVPLGKSRHSDQAACHPLAAVEACRAYCTDEEALEAMEATLAEPRCRCPAPRLCLWDLL